MSQKKIAFYIFSYTPQTEFSFKAAKSLPLTKDPNFVKKVFTQVKKQLEGSS
jgi:hypothetical protein